MTFIIVFLMVILLGLFYFNCISTFIVFKDSEFTYGVRFARALIIWLIPFVGCALLLRFSYQENETKLHHTLVPKIISKWLYDESAKKLNSDRDENDLKCQTGFHSF